jgi:hypothetical protein
MRPVPVCPYGMLPIFVAMDAFVAASAAFAMPFRFGAPVEAGLDAFRFGAPVFAGVDAVFTGEPVFAGVVAVFAGAPVFAGVDAVCAGEALERSSAATRSLMQLLPMTPLLPLMLSRVRRGFPLFVYTRALIFQQ